MQSRARPSIDNSLPLYALHLPRPSFLQENLDSPFYNFSKNLNGVHTMNTSRF